MTLEFNRDRYIQIARRGGYSAAISQLHRDIESWEQQTFEGPEGFQANLLKELQDIREFSRELWEMALRDPEGKSLR